MYKDNEGSPLFLTPKQLDIFNLIWQKPHPRNHLMCFTRYGKSFTVALAVLTRASTFPEKWGIVAPSEKKARIIMGYVIEHAFDNEITKSKLQYDERESLDRLRRERSKNKINFKHADGTLGEIFILSADSRNKAQAGDALMGFGSANLILDEAALIDDDIEAKIFRMLADKPENFYLKIGNPFRRNHFLKDYQNRKYHHLRVDWQDGMAEGRITQEFIDEAKRKPHFEVLFENRFPAADAVDDKGWSFLITDLEYERALDTMDEKSEFGVKCLGVDVARGGGNYNVWVLRSGNYAKVVAKNQDPDLMSVVGTTIRLAREYKVNMRNVYVDDTGVGAGVTDRLKEQRFYIKPVKLAEKAMADDKFKNKRAECYWKTKEWMMTGGKLRNTDDWSELMDVKYRADSGGKLQMMPKDVMRREGFESPDTADALMLTFATPPYNEQYEKKKQEEEQEDYDPYSIF